MRRYLKLYGAFFVNRCKVFLEYRASFLIGALSTFALQAAGLFAIWAVMRQVPHLQGWSLAEVFFLYGLVNASRGLEHMFADNLWTLGRHQIRSGSFDRYLLRPVDPLFHLLADRFNEDGLGGFLIGLGLMLKSSQDLSLEWNAITVLCAVCAVLGGGLIFVALNLLTCVSAFWIVDSAPVTLAVHDLHEFAKYPLGMYGNGIKQLLTWVVPYGLASYYPALFVLGREQHVLAFAALPIALVLLAFAYRVWLFGLRHYAGAGS